MNDFHFAVVVGIDLYPGIRNLNSARGDAQAFSNWLKDAAGGSLPDANVQLILEQGPFDTADSAKPTRDAVNRAFRKVHEAARAIFKADPTKWPQSRLYVYFSGHGLGPEPGEVAFLMADATDGELGNNIPCALYLKYYEKSQDFHEVVIFSDCCRTERVDAPLLGPPFTPNKKNYGVVVSALGFATQYKSVAYEPAQPDEAARGYYTQALLDGLKGGAVDTESATGQINSTSLQNYLRARVQALTKDKRSPQTPGMYTDPSSKIIFCEGVVRPTYRVNLAFPSHFQGRVALLDGKSNQIDFHDANGQQWQKTLTDGLYEVRPDPPDPAVEFAGEGLFRVLGEDRSVNL